MAKQRVLDRDDFVRINLPRPLWGADLAGVPESVRAGVTKFLGHIKEVKTKGYSLYVCGSKGAGKSGVGALVLKEARSWGFTAYAIAVPDLRDAVRAHTAFDFESSVFDRCRTVDFLLLDDLRLTDITEKFFTINDIRNLVISRFDRGLITVITSPVLPSAWRDSNCELISDAVLKACATLEVVGEDRHAASVQSKNEFLSP